MTTTGTPRYEGDCDRCGDWHEAEYSHESRLGEGHIYAVTCPVDGMTQWHTTEGIRPMATRRNALPLDLDPWMVRN